MNVKDLSREQLTELKQRYYTDVLEHNISYYEMALINELVTDEEIFDYYSSTTFTCDDFFCTCGQYDVYME